MVPLKYQIMTIGGVPTPDQYTMVYGPSGVTLHKGHKGIFPFPTFKSLGLDGTAWSACQNEFYFCFS